MKAERKRENITTISYTRSNMLASEIFKRVPEVVEASRGLEHTSWVFRPHGVGRCRFVSEKGQE